MTSRLFRLYERLVLRHPVIWLFVIIVLCGLAGWQAKNFHLDASAQSLTLEHDQALAYYRKIAKRYGGSDFVLVTYTPKQGPLFDHTALDRVHNLEQDLKGVTDVQSVYSLLDVPLLFSPKVQFSDLSGGYKTVLSPGVNLKMAEQEFTEKNPLYKDLLVSKDGRTAALLVTFKRDQHYFDLLNKRNSLLDKQNHGGLSDAQQRELAKVSEEYSQYNTQTQERTAKEISQIRGIMKQYSDHGQLFVGGVPLIATDVIRFVRSDLQTFGTGVLVFMVLMLFLIFRKPRWVVVPMLCSAVTALLMTGWLGFMDWKVTVISSNYLSLLLIITMSVTLHLIVHYRELLEENPEADQPWLLRETAAHMMRPSVYMMLTTMVGFSSLVVSDIRPVIDFGWMMTIGLGVALVICFLLFPTLLAFVKPEKPNEGRDITRGLTLGFATVTRRYRLPLLVLAVLVMVGAVWGMSKLSVENRFINYFQKNTEIYQGMRMIDRKLGGTTPLDIIIDAPKTSAAPASTGKPADKATGQGGDDGFGKVEKDPFAGDNDKAASGGDDGFGKVEQDPFASGNGNGGQSDNGFGGPGGDQDPFSKPASGKQGNAGVDLKDAYWYTPQRLAQVAKIDQYLNSLPETGKVLSIATTYRVAEKINGGPLSYVQLMLLASFIPADLRDKLVDPYMSHDGREIRISVRVIDSQPNLNRNALLKKIRHDLTTKFGLQPDQVHLTGALVLYNNLLQSLFNSQIKTLGYVFVAILLMMLLLFRSIPVALIAMVPSLVSAGTVLGLMGWIGLPLDLMTITITAITIGIAVDDTIHYVHRFHQELPKDRDYLAAMRRCHGSIGKAMYYTSVVIIVGFSILALSNFNPTVYFGLLTGLAMLVALLSNLTLLPALLVTVKPKLRAG